MQSVVGKVSIVRDNCGICDLKLRSHLWGFVIFLGVFFLIFFCTGY